MLNYEFPPLGGGASPVSYEIAKGYVKLGHSVDVVTMGYKDLPRVEVKDGIRIYRLDCLRSKKEICRPHEMLSFLVAGRVFLAKHLKKHKYDVNHTHFIIPTGILALWAKKRFGIPYIISVHGSDVPGYNTDRFKFLHKFTRPLLIKICDNSKKVIALSDYLKGLIIKNIKPYNNLKLIKIPNGIYPDKFVPRKKKKIILSTGRLLPRKGFQYLIKSVSDKNYGYEVHIAGDGPMMPELKKLANSSKTKIVFHGWMDNKSKEYKELLETASIYVLASEKENASISLLEAMSAGCAVITTNISGCPETVGDAGIIIGPRDSTQIKQQVKSLIENSSHIKNLGKKARSRVLSNFRWDKIIGAYEFVL